MNKIEITPELLAELKEKAEKATPGPWGVCAATAAKNSFNSILIHGNEQIAIVKTPRGLGRSGSTKDIRERDAAYIAAANPQVMLALVARIEELEANNYGPEILNDPQALTASYFAGAMAEGRKRDAEIEILEKEANWLAEVICKKHSDIRRNGFVPDCPTGRKCDNKCVSCWREAARKAVKGKDNK